MPSRRWNSSTKIIVGSLLALTAILLLVTFRQMIAPTIVAFLFTFVLSYPVSWVQQRTGWARTTALLAVYTMAGLAILLGVVLIVPRLDTMVGSLQRTLTDLLSALQGSVESPAFELGPLRFSADEALAQADDVVAAILAFVTQNPAALARGLTTSIVSSVYVVVLTFWLVKDWYKLERFIIELIPADYQEEMRRLGNELAAIWQAFLRGQLTLALVVGLITWVCLLILGMPNAGGLALLAGLLEFLPSIGPAISGTIGTVLALFQGSTWMPVGNVFFAVIVGVVYAIIGQLEGVWLIPRFVGGRVKLHPAVTFVGIITGALTFGVLGILLAAPVIASSRVLITYISRKLTDREPFESEVASQAVLAIPGMIAGRKIEAIVFEMDGTLTEVDLSAVEWAATHFNFLNRIIPPEARRTFARRLLARIEAPVNFLANQLYRWRWTETEERVGPALDLLRGQPPLDELILRPDARETLMALSRSYRLALVSTRRREELTTFLERNDLNSGLFDLVVAREDVRNILPHVDPLQRIAVLLGVDTSKMLLVSDTDVGLRAGRAAEMATAGMLDGIPLPDELHEADILLVHPADLSRYL
jgi:predicted PurR-regulated permease PerM/phosphoglycolate phosphatase-like HAD superfamily hydrolase